MPYKHQAYEDDDDEDQVRQDADEGDDDQGVQAQVQGDDDDDEPVNRRQPQDNDEEDEDEIPRHQQHTRQDDDEDEEPQPRGRAQEDDEDDDAPLQRQPKGKQSKSYDEDDEEEEEGTTTKPSTVNVNFNISLNSDNSDLHEGGTMFTKKLLAELFSGHEEDDEPLGAHQIEHEHVDSHAQGDWSIVELKTENAEGDTIYLKAKMDTGADDNVMSYDIYQLTGLEFTAYEGPEAPFSFTTGGGESIDPLGVVELECEAGIKPENFTAAFQVIEGLPHEDFDVLIGKPLMEKAHMLMVNPNFAHPAHHKNLCLMAVGPKSSASKSTAAAFVKQRQDERAKAYAIEKAKEKAAQGQRGGRKPPGRRF
ncbi:MAG: hypothetical protein Q9170_002767 [Blastenia crenularia]